jgi:hypothetical protein
MAAYQIDGSIGAPKGGEITLVLLALIEKDLRSIETFSDTYEVPEMTTQWIDQSLQLFHI